MLKYFDKSFSEIYQIEHGELKEDKSSRSRPNFLLLFYGLITLLLLLAIILTASYYLDKKKEKEVSKINNKVKKEENKLPEDKKSNIKYVKIGEIEIIGNNDLNKFNEKKGIAKKEIAKANVKPVVNTKKVSVKTNNNNTSNKKLSIMVKRIDEDKLQNIKSILKGTDKEIKIIKSYYIQNTVWELYRINPYSKKYIAGRPVTFVKKFKSKEEAVQYAKAKKINALIKKRNIKNKVYDVKILNFNDRKDIHEFKKRLGIK
ncbi:hypothetical protein OWM07_05325 [Deferribacter thermophilus]|uniref:hypothetical protein n=1 Tax=Deferribacter thermophilus TaxID=53573 RepID=UPI003C2675FF